jgi:hypothetical protein
MQKLTFETLDGPITLQELLTEQFTLLLFLRHLA